MEFTIFQPRKLTSCKWISILRLNGKDKGSVRIKRFTSQMVMGMTSKLLLDLISNSIGTYNFKERTAIFGVQTIITYHSAGYTHLIFREDLVCHNNKDGTVQRILGNSYGQPIWGDMWNSSAPYRFCNKDHMHPEYGRVLVGDSDGKVLQSYEQC